MLTEIRRVLADGGTVYLLGGEAALSPEVDRTLRDGGYRTVRYAGADRFATAAVIARVGLGTPDTVMLATGLNLSDALTAGTAAALHGGAVLLADGERRAGATVRCLADNEPGQVFAVGGPAARAHGDAAPVSGVDRFATAVAVAERFVDDPTAVGLTTGHNFPDAMAGGGHIARRGGALLLTSAAPLAGATRSTSRRSSGGRLMLHVYGGSAVVADSVLAEVEAIVLTRSSGALPRSLWAGSAGSTSVSGVDYAPTSGALRPAASALSADRPAGAGVLSASQIDTAVILSVRVRAPGADLTNLRGGCPPASFSPAP